MAGAYASWLCTSALALYNGGMMHDARGAEVKVGDCLLDERGRLYRVEPTDASLQRERLARVVPAKLRHGTLQPVGTAQTYLRLALVFVVAPATLDETAFGRQRIHQLLYEAHCRQGRQAELARRRAEIDQRRHY